MRDLAPAPANRATGNVPTDALLDALQVAFLWVLSREVIGAAGIFGNIKRRKRFVSRQRLILSSVDVSAYQAPQSRVASVIAARKLASSSPHMRIGYGLAAVLARIVVVLPHPCLMPAVRAGYFNVRH